MNFYIVDCFTDQKFSGNQLAVFLDDAGLDEGFMQKAAKEMNFSETVFLDPHPYDDGSFSIRIFTPETEIPFAGHPVLGTAYLIKEKLLNHPGNVAVTLRTKAGSIPVTLKGRKLFMRQNQPVFMERYMDYDIAPLVGLSEEDLVKSFPIQAVSTGLDTILVPVVSADLLKRCIPYRERLETFYGHNRKCNLMLFALEDEDVYSRVFMDETGSPEDPATGSAHGCLAAYMLKYDIMQKSKISYVAFQGSELGRPSKLYIEASLTNGVYVLQVGGQAIVTASGEMPL